MNNVTSNIENSTFLKILNLLDASIAKITALITAIYYVVICVVDLIRADNYSRYYEVPRSYFYKFMREEAWLLIILLGCLICAWVLFFPFIQKLRKKERLSWTESILNSVLLVCLIAVILLSCFQELFVNYAEETYYVSAVLTTVSIISIILFILLICFFRSGVDVNVRATKQQTKFETKNKPNKLSLIIFIPLILCLLLFYFTVWKQIIIDPVNKKVYEVVSLTIDTKPKPAVVLTKKDNKFLIMEIDQCSYEHKELKLIKGSYYLINMDNRKISIMEFNHIVP